MVINKWRRFGPRPEDRGVRGKYKIARTDFEPEAEIIQ